MPSMRSYIMVVRIKACRVSKTSMIRTGYILALIASLPVADPPATQPAQPPLRLVLPATLAVRQFTTGVEEPGLYAILKAVSPTAALGLQPETPFDRISLLARPQDHVGHLLITSGRLIETKALQLLNSLPPVPAVVWSSLVLEHTSNQAIQVLTLRRQGNRMLSEAGSMLGCC